MNSSSTSTPTLSTQSGFTETQAFGGHKIFKILLGIAVGIIAIGAVFWLLTFWFFWIIAMVGTILALTFGILYLVFRKLSMTTVVSKNGIEVLWKPFHKTPELFAWNDIDNLNLALNPRPGVYGNKWTPNTGQLYVMGNKEGIQLVMKTGKRIFIGSGKAGEFFSYCKKYVAQVMIA
ncbi:MAG: hypothetical protein V4722_15215 [Bacteroidota bacterium]